MEMYGTIALGIAAAGFILVQQFQARPLNSRLLFGVPVALTLWGAGSLSHSSNAESVLFFALNAAVAAGLGIWRGSSVRVWTDAGQTFQQGTIVTLGLWLVSLAVRFLLVAAGHLA